jgi:TonB-linked SusC/RagA family outer membrane protein
MTRVIHGKRGILSVLTALVLTLPAPTNAQDDPSRNAPVFFMALASGKTMRLDIARTPLLARRIDVDLYGLALGAALDTISARAGFRIAYNTDVVNRGARVYLRANLITVAAALTDVLSGSGVDVVFNSDGGAALVKRPLPPPVGTITGVVRDARTGQPVPGATVIIEGSRISGITSSTGVYRIANAPSGARTIRVRRLGYQPQTVSVTVPDEGVVTADVTLGQVATQLNEVVTTATGEQRRVELGNVIGHLDGDSLAREAPITRLSDMIGARIPGVQIVPNTGFTGESPRIRIRGISGITLTRDPLLYVDGVRVDNSTGAMFGNPVISFLSYGHVPGRVNDIDPNDIESVEIVKGPSAATLYGTDAANGVILIRTKRGVPGRARWSMSVEGGALAPAVAPPENYFSWGRSVATGAVQRCTLVQSAAHTCTIDSLTRFDPLQDHATTFVGDGYRTKFGLQLKGGSDLFRYFASLDREDETNYLALSQIEQERISAERGGAAIPDDQLRPNVLARTNFRGSATANFAKGDITLSSGLTRSDTRIPRGTEWDAAYLGPGYRDAFDGYRAADGRPGEIFAIRSQENATHFTNGLVANWHPLSWLTTRGTVGFDFVNSFYDGLQRRDEGPTLNRAAGRRLNMRTSLGNTTVDLGGSTSFQLSPLVSSRTSVGAQYNRRLEAITTTSATGLPPGSETVTGAATITGAEKTIESVVAGGYVEESIGLRERLFISAAVRGDGASSFGKNFSTALYPKFGLSWLVANNESPQRVPGLGSLRLRAAYGQSGVQPGATDALPLLLPISSLVDGVSLAGATLTALGNEDLKPERTQELEAGGDAEWFGGRVKIEATYYRKLSHDALINRPLALSIGITSRRENIGSVSNRGWEGLVTLVPISTDAVVWDVSLNGSINHNKFESAAPGLVFSTSTSTFRVGYPLFSRWDKPILSYGDANGNGIIEASEVKIGDTAVYLGESLPPRQLTVSNGISLFRERLRISSQFDYKGGHLGENFTEINRCLTALACRGANDPSASLWEQARAVAASATSRTLAGYLEDASFVRLRELSIAYRLENQRVPLLGGRTMTVSLTGRNLKLWTDYSSPDPEVNSSAGALQLEGNSDNPTAPQTRLWLLRVNVDW